MRWTGRLTTARQRGRAGIGGEIIDDSDSGQWPLQRGAVKPRKLHYITLLKNVFRVPKITRSARTLYEIKGVIWEYSYEGKHVEKR